MEVERHSGKDNQKRDTGLGNGWQMIRKETYQAGGAGDKTLGLGNTVKFGSAVTPVTRKHTMPPLSA